MGFKVTNMSVKDVYCDNDSKNDLLMRAAGFIVQVIILNDSGQISAGYPHDLECCTAHIACKFAKQWKKSNSCSGKKMEVGPNS